MLGQLIVTLRLGVVGCGLEQQPDQLRRSDLAELHLEDMERGSRAIDGKKLIECRVHVLGALAVEIDGADFSPIERPVDFG
jgi:hypothetical protein